MGDAIQTMPVACALRDRFPQAFLAWAVEIAGGGAAARACGPRRSDRTAARLAQVARRSVAPAARLRELRFDMAIDVQSLTKSAILAWLSGAKRRIGFGNPGGRELSKWFNNERVDPKATHVVDRYLELLRPLGIESPAVRFHVPEHEEDRDAAEESSDELGVEAALPSSIPGRAGRRNSGPPSATRPWPPLGRAWQLPTLVVWAGQAERIWPSRSSSSAGGSRAGWAAVVASRIGGPGPAGEAVHRFRYRPAAPGGGRGHALRGTVWSLARLAARPVRPAAHRPAEDVLRGPRPGPPHRPGDLHGEHQDGDGVRGVRSRFIAK